jgi:hypothetical protein
LMEAAPAPVIVAEGRPDLSVVDAAEMGAPPPAAAPERPARRGAPSFEELFRLASGQGPVAATADDGEGEAESDDAEVDDAAPVGGVDTGNDE